MLNPHCGAYRYGDAFRNVTDELTPRRSHLRAFISADDGKTWQEGLLLDDRLNISYHDGFESKDGAKNK